MDDFGERHAKLVLVAHELDAVLNVWQLLAECPDAGQAAVSPLHEVVQVYIVNDFTETFPPPPTMEIRGMSISATGTQHQAPVNVGRVR